MGQKQTVLIHIRPVLCFRPFSVLSFLFPAGGNAMKSECSMDNERE